MAKTKIYTDDEFIEVDIDDIGELESAMRFKAENIKAKAEPELFIAVAEKLSELWNECMKIRLDNLVISKNSSAMEVADKITRARFDYDENENLVIMTGYSCKDMFGLKELKALAKHIMTYVEMVEEQENGN